eukprot:GHUV01054227.1.p1 GENE.GHUV01054227.1~~GHUV01054227.1.p1  ORF type:complete len:140 (-),score=13.64 GHUV01054227.1:576-995(-)
MIRRPFRIEADGWPNQAGQEISVKMGQTLTLTTRDVECTDTVLPVTYSKFAGMMESGDTLYVGRYLVSGADSASLYVEVCKGTCCVGDCCGVYLMCTGHRSTADTAHLHFELHIRNRPGSAVPWMHGCRGRFVMALPGV